jgi:hypothetical protein
MAIHAFVHYFGLSYAQQGHTTEWLLFLLDVLLILFIFRRVTGKSKVSTLHAESLWDWGICLLAFAFGVWMARQLYPHNWTLDATTVFHFPLLALLLFLFLRYLNSTQAFARKSIQAAPSLQGFWLIFFSGALMLSFHALFGALLIWSAVFILYEKPTQWFRYAPGSILFKSLLYLFFVLFGFLCFGAPLVGINVVHLVLILLLFNLLEILRFFVARRIHSSF